MPGAIVLPEPDESGPVSRWLLFWSFASVAVSAAVYAWIYFAGLGFLRLFRGFGEDLPWLTSFVLATHQFYGLLLLVGLIPCAVLFANRGSFRRRRLIALITAGFCLSFTSLVVFTAAIYLPIFQAGPATQ